MRTKKGKGRSFFVIRLSVRRKVRFRYIHATIDINNPPNCDHDPTRDFSFRFCRENFYRYRYTFFWTVGRQFGLMVDLSEVQNDDDDDDDDDDDEKKKTSGRSARACVRV